MSKIVVLPGSRWQLELVKKIKEMGNLVYVISPESNPPCKATADGYCQSDIFDAEKVCSYIEEIKPDGIMSDECDIAMPIIANLGEKYGFHTLTQKDAALYTDKYLMREFSKNNDFPIPKYRLCRTVDDVRNFLEVVGSEIVIKPIDSNSSHGVFTVSSASDIERYFDECITFSRVDKSVLAEQYINGTEFTVDGIKTPTHHYTLAISQKHHFEHNRNIADELFFTHFNPDYDYEKLKKINDEFIIRSNLKYGFTHAEYKYENDQFYMIEIAARGGGNMISSVITQYMSGYDTYPYLINCALGSAEEADFSIRETQNRAAVLKFFDTPGQGGFVKEIKGMDYLKQSPDIAYYQMNFKVGDRIQDCVSDSARIGFYIACAESKQRLIKTMDEVKEKIKIILE